MYAQRSSRFGLSKNVSGLQDRYLQIPEMISRARNTRLSLHTTRASKQEFKDYKFNVNVIVRVIQRQNGPHLELSFPPWRPDDKLAGTQQRETKHQTAGQTQWPSKLSSNSIAVRRYFSRLSLCHICGSAPIRFLTVSGTNFIYTCTFLYPYFQAILSFLKD